MNLNISEEMRLSALLVANGNQHLFQGKYLEAVALYAEAIAYNSKSLGAFQGRAFCRVQLLAETPIEEHLPLIQSIAEDLKTAVNLADIMLNEVKKIP
jgi:hypothetical protein